MCSSCLPSNLYCGSGFHAGLIFNSAGVQISIVNSSDVIKNKNSSGNKIIQGQCGVIIMMLTSTKENIRLMKFFLFVT